MCARPASVLPKRKRADGRTSGAKRYAALVAAFENQLGGGDLVEAERSLVRQAATLQLRLEQLTEDVIKGLPVDDTLLVKLAGTSRRALAAITAKTKPAGGMTLNDYLIAKAAAAQTDDDGDADDE